MEPDARFCGACGTHVLACASCGQALEPEDRVCAHCGTPAPALPSAAVPAITPAQRSAWDRVLEHLVDATAGEFEIQGELGRGGMAAVYLAREIGLNRMVAIKVMSPTLLMDDSMVQRFRQEAVTLANLNHPNIVPIYAVREDDELNFFVMKFIAGRALDHILVSAPQLPIAVVRALLFQVGGALATAHRRGIVHRDIKPANILVDTDGNGIVTDFGIAKVAEAPGQTQTGTAIGTPSYMSPEQCRGDAITAASDQYSLGVVAYEMLTGQPPFTGAALTIMQAHAGSPPPPIGERRPDCPPELEAALMRMLAKDPAERWPTVTQAITAAEGVQLEADDPVRTELIALATAGGTLQLRPLDVAVPAAHSGPRGGSKGRRRTAAGQEVAGAAKTGAQRSTRIWWFAGVPVVATVVIAAVVMRKPTPPIVTQQPITNPPAASTPHDSVPAPIAGTGTGVARRLALLVVTPRDTTLATGARLRLRIVGRDSAGKVVDSLAPQWRSSDARVATVSASGVVVVVGVTGTATITGAVSDKEASMRVAVAATAPGSTPATVPVAPPSPAAAALPTSDDLHRAVSECAKALSSGNQEQVTKLFRPHDKQDADNLGKFLEIVTRGEAQLSTDPVGEPIAGPLTSDGVAVKFSMRVQYRKPAGGKFDNTRPFIAQLQVVARRWTVTECRADGKLSIN
jgi:predicted Ser/Thr protein kinase